MARMKATTATAAMAGAAMDIGVGLLLIDSLVVSEANSV